MSTPFALEAEAEATQNLVNLLLFSFLLSQPHKETLMKHRLSLAARIVVFAPAPCALQGGG